MFYSPLTFVFMIVFFISALFFLVFVQINVIALAFTKAGIPSQYIFIALLGVLFGSFVNIPLKKIPQEKLITKTWVDYLGFRYVVPARRRKETVLAVNLGGALVPTLLSLYLLLKAAPWLSALVATAFMIGVTYRLAKPVRGVGIALPAFAPPLLAALVSMVVAYDHAPVVAYISGTLGSLVGADLLNIKKIGSLEAPVASIGGAGTFDGIFLNGILAVLLAAILV